MASLVGIMLIVLIVPSLASDMLYMQYVWMLYVCAASEKSHREIVFSYQSSGQGRPRRYNSYTFGAKQLRIRQVWWDPHPCAQLRLLKKVFKLNYN